MAPSMHMPQLASCAQLKMWFRKHRMLAWFEGSVEICCLECKALGEVGGLFCHTEKGQLWPPISPQPERTTL